MPGFHQIVMRSSNRRFWLAANVIVKILGMNLTKKVQAYEKKSVATDSHLSFSS